MADAKKTSTYILTGKSHSGFKDGEPYVYMQGDEVELTENEYASFWDKFEVHHSERKKQAKEGLAVGEQKITPTKPEAAGDGKNQAQPVPGAKETNVAGTEKGAGAAANSSNTAKT